ncbi:MAG: hypothetical protein IPJ01_00550 [Micavibrio sp.]|nr:hypothetical protein [Micavibrio sp.]
MIIDCKNLLSAEKVTSLKATYIQCAATIDAAWIQGVFTSCAGLLALVAGYLAYRAATRQVRLHEEKEKSLQLSYKNRTIFVLRYLRQQLLDMLIWSNRFATKQDKPVAVPPYKLHIPAEIDSANWQNNALLPAEVTGIIQRVNERCMHFDSFLQEVSSLKLHSQDYARQYVSFKSKKDMPDGGVQFECHNVAEQVLYQGTEINDLIISALES